MFYFDYGKGEETKRSSLKKECIFLILHPIRNISLSV